MVGAILLLVYGCTILWVGAEMVAERPDNFRIGLSVVSMIVTGMAAGGYLAGGGM